MDKRYNMYWIQDGMQKVNTGLSLAAIRYNVQEVLSSGGEITGIIDSEKD